MAVIEMEIRSRCMELSPFGARVFTAVTASRVAPVIQVYCSSVGQEDEYFKIDAGIRFVWNGLAGQPVTARLVVSALNKVESLAEAVEEDVSDAAARCADALRVVAAAMDCHLEPAARFAADASSAAFDLVADWLESEFEEPEESVWVTASLDQEIRRDARFVDEVSSQETLLRAVAEFGDGPLDKRTARRLQYDAEDWAIKYMNWMNDLVARS